MDIDRLIAVLEQARGRYPDAEIRKSGVGNICLIVNDFFVAYVDLTTLELVDCDD
jgi:hypothetical protein